MKKLGLVSSFAFVSALGCAAPVSAPAPAPEDVAQAEQAFGEPTDTVPRSPSATSVQYDQDAIIDAPIDTVWNLLVDLPHYGDWNPWVTHAEGTVTPGAHVKVNVLMGPITEQADHVVMTVTPNTFFCWRDSGWNSWFVYGQRCRWLEQQADGKTHFHQQLLIDGALDVVAKVVNGPCLESGMAAETRAIKATAEARAAAAHP